LPDPCGGFCPQVWIKATRKGKGEENHPFWPQLEHLFAYARLRKWTTILQSPEKLYKKGESTMGKYLLLWEIDTTRIPVSPKERGLGWNALMEMVKQDIKKGITKDWGAFVGELRGYAVHEGTDLELMNALQQYSPFVHFKVHPIASVGQVDEMIKVLTK
jgi:hypothetical protein